MNYDPFDDLPPVDDAHKQNVQDLFDKKRILTPLPFSDRVNIVRQRSNPIIQKFRFVIALIVIFGILAGISAAIIVPFNNKAAKRSKPIPPTDKGVQNALRSQQLKWNNANSKKCLAIQLSSTYNLFLSENAHADTYSHIYDADTKEFNTGASIKDQDIYHGMLQVYNVRWITQLKLAGGNLFGTSNYSLNIAGSLSFGSLLPWDHGDDVDQQNLVSKQLEAKMTFAYDAKTKKIKSINFQSLATTNSEKAMWYQDYNFSKKEPNQSSSVFLPWLKNLSAQEQTPANPATTTISDLYSTSFTPFSYQPSSNQLADAFYNQPTSETNRDPLFKNLLFPQATRYQHPRSFAANPKASAFIGVRTPFVFSRDFVDGKDDVTQSLIGQSFFSNLMFNNLDFQTLKETAKDQTQFTSPTVNVYGRYKYGINSLYNNPTEPDNLQDSWSMTGVSQYYGLKDKNGNLLFPQTNTDPIIVKNHIGSSANRAPNKHDSTDIHNLNGGNADSKKQKFTTLKGADMVYPGFGYQQMPFYDFNSDHSVVPNHNDPFMQYNFGLYHSADIGQSINQMSNQTTYGQTNTSVANFTNGLGMANISFGSEKNPYGLPSRNAPTINLYDQITNLLASNYSNDFSQYRNFNLDNSNVMKSGDYAHGMPAISSHLSTSNAKVQNMFFKPNLNDDYDTGGNTNLNNYLLAIAPRLILKSDFMFIPYTDSMSHNKLSGNINNYDNDAKRWALALIMPCNQNLVQPNPIIRKLFTNPEDPAPKIHANVTNPTKDIGGDQLDHGSNLKPLNTGLASQKWSYNDINFQVHANDSLPSPSNWWASMDNRNIFDNHNVAQSSDPTLSAMAEVGVSNQISNDKNPTNPPYPNLAFVYNKYNQQRSTMSAHPGAFSWMPFNIFSA